MADTISALEWPVPYWVELGKPTSVRDDDKLAHHLMSQKLEAISGRG
jgi:hypothetical protein